MKLDHKDVNFLIKLGNNLELKDALIPILKNHDYINRLHWNEWETQLASKNDNEIIAVYKAMIFLEKELKWSGGSVAGAIWVYKIIEKRGLDINSELADYGLKNSDNPYIPFGTSYYGERNINDYYQYKKEKLNKVKNNGEINKGRNKKRSSCIAELRKLSFEQRGSIRKELKEKYESYSYIKKLEIIASDEKFPPEYYPTEWIVLSQDEIRNIPLELKIKLYDKLSTKTKGAWKRFSESIKI